MNEFEHNVTLGSFTKHYQFGGRLIAMREGLNAGSSVSFFATDHLGSTAATIWANGSVRSQLRYDPWGKQRYAQHTTPTGYRYTSQRWDSGLGLYDYNARYYDPHNGRFISADTLVPDPAAPQAFNRYAYVLGNPLRYTDPTGHLTVEEVQNYFGYSDKDKKDKMVSDGWDKELVDLLFSDGFTWSDVFSFTYQGQQVEAMLILMAANGDNTSFRGAFWGMSGPLKGVGLYGKEIQGGVNRHTDAAELLERQFRYGISYHNIPISDAWSFMVPNAYGEIGTAGFSRWMTYAGGAVFLASLVIMTAGLGTPAALTALSIASGTTTLAGVGLQLAVDTGHAEETKKYFIMTYFEPLNNQYDIGRIKPVGQF